MPLLDPGTCIEGYCIQDLTGDGASGFAYSASTPTNKIVIMKFVPLSNSFYEKEFKKEGAYLKRFRNTTEIVSYIDCFVSGSHGVIVMEKLDMDLLDYVEKSGSIPEEDAKIIFKQICTAVHVLHRNNIAHLDLKPENIFLNDMYSVKLGDLGSCFQWSKETPEKFGLSGTSYYCAPEVVSFYTCTTMF